MIYLKRFFKTSLTFFLGNAFTKIISFFLLPMYTNLISPESFGMYGYINTFVNTFVPIVFISIWDSVFRYAFISGHDKKVLIKNGFFVMFIGSIAYFLGMYIVNLFVNIETFLLVYLYSISYAYQYLYTVISRIYKNNTLFVVSGVTNSSVTLLLNYILIKYFNYGISALYISSIIGTVIQIGMIEYKYRVLKSIKETKFDFEYIKSMIRFSIPLTASSSSNWLLSGLSQTIIIYMFTSVYNGYYTVATRFSSIIILTVSVIQFAWNELAYDINNEKKKMNFYSVALNEMFSILCLIFPIIIIIIKIMFPFFIANQYQESIYIIPFVLLGTISNAYSGFIGTIFLAELESNTLFKTTLYAGIINVILGVLLAFIFGFYGVIYGLSISYLYYSISRLYILNKKHSIYLNKKSLFSFIILLLGMFIYYLFDLSIYYNLMIVFIFALTALYSNKKYFFFLCKRVLFSKGGKP